MRAPVLALSLSFALAAGAGVASLALPVASAEEPAVAALSFEEHARRAGAAILPLRGAAAIHVSLMGQSQSIELELDGMAVVVDPSGLLLMSNTSLGGSSSPILKQLEEALGGAKISVDVQRIRVQLPDEETERDALIVLRDPTTDLAWLQVLGLEGRAIAALDLTGGATPRVGQRLVGVTRRDRMFDYAPSVVRGYVAARIATPRELWSVGGDFSEIGHVAFDVAGRPLGVLVPQMEAGADSPELGVFLLPLDAAQKSLEAAKARVPEALAAHEKAKGEAGKEGDATPEPKKAPEPESPGGPTQPVEPPPK